ncbi:MAG: hypothetical protein NVS3B14_21140 [Ktedonobacteraceae bacterium]
MKVIIQIVDQNIPLYLILTPLTLTLLTPSQYDTGGKYTGFIAPLLNIRGQNLSEMVLPTSSP